MTTSPADLLPGISGAELNAMRESAADLLALHGLTETDPACEFGELASPWPPPVAGPASTYDKVRQSHFMIMFTGPAA